MAKVLVIDDDPDMTSLMEIVLAREGYEVLLASNGALGIELAIGEQPDLILLDILMPAFGGVKVLEHLGQAESTAQIPVIAITAGGEDVERRVKEMEAFGPIDLFRKPFSPGDLVERIHQILDD